VRRSFVLVFVAVAACHGGDPHADPDAPVGGDAPPQDATAYPACAEFSSAGVSVPAHVVGTLGTANVESPAECGVVNAPFGTESAGPDRVIPLKNLIAGTPYVVRVTSRSDLAFYVTTGCATPTGPGADQCVLFEDATSGDREVGRFVAGGSIAYVVVDFYASHPPSSLDFTLDVFAEACHDGSQCGGSTPACFEGQCVGCVTSFDCTNVARPTCAANQTCQPGVDTCTSDGTDEPNNDGPAGASAVALDGGGHSVLTGKICSSPSTEADFLSFDVTSLGEIWDFQLGWAGGRDIDLEVFDATGKELALSFWEQPERVRLTYLPLGRYYVRIREFASTADPAPVTYTLTTQRTLGAPCVSAASCAAEYRNQIFRGRCTAGACVEIDGNGAIAEGGSCDSQSDCGLALSCPSFFFVANGDTRETCSRACGVDADCAALGANHVCTTYLANNFCVLKCTTDDQCPTSISTTPTSGPWARLRCDAPTGRCLP
jgi:hypothetical protein